MRVIVHDELFDGRVSEPHLFELLNFAFYGRHRILVQRGPLFERWRSSLSQTALEQYDEALATSNELESREPSVQEIHLGAGGVLVDEAIHRLRRPFLLFLEDETSDRAFIEAVATPPYRDHLRKMRERGWLEFRSRGGITNILKLLDTDLDEFPGDTWRMFVLFDSDAQEPGEPHRDARDVKARCEGLGVRYWMLTRRATENYLTRPALEGWADREANAVALRRCVETLYDEWFNARPERRHHFHMKKGFEAMRPHRSMPHSPTYQGVPPHVEHRLSKGLGSNLFKAFMGDEIRESDLRAEGAWDELSAGIEALIRSMR
ncbi:MAG: hypothetical protein IT372_27530 [Polyangiaceae bacterium]|nr:hypothetical protein [Polyangiaceae bacterium]